MYLERWMGERNTFFNLRIFPVFSFTMVEIWAWVKPVLKRKGWSFFAVENGKKNWTQQRNDFFFDHSLALGKH